MCVIAKLLLLGVCVCVICFSWFVRCSIIELEYGWGLCTTLNRLCTFAVCMLPNICWREHYNAIDIPYTHTSQLFSIRIKYTFSRALCALSFSLTHSLFHDCPFALSHALYLSLSIAFSLILLAHSIFHSILIWSAWQLAMPPEKKNELCVCDMNEHANDGDNFYAINQFVCAECNVECEYINVCAFCWKMQWAKAFPLKNESSHSLCVLFTR